MDLNEQSFNDFMAGAFVPEAVVGGWLEDREAWTIYLMGQECARLGLPGAELGTFRGRSAVHFCRGSGGQVPFYCVDSWAYPEGCGLDVDTYSKYFIPACKQWLDTGMVIPVKSDTADAAWTVADDSLGGLFIDADHSFAGIDRDFKAWYPKVKKGGLILFHDCGADAWPDVQPYIESLAVGGLVGKVGRQVTCMVTRKC